MSKEINNEQPNNYKFVDYQHFDQMDMLCKDGGELLKGIYTYGFEIPSAIQMKAIPPITEGLDLIAQSQSGTGKTGAFTIGMLSRIDKNEQYPQGIIIGNTRELAIQIHHVISKLAKFMNIQISLCIGGTTGKDTQTNLNEAMNSHILVGTPGRIVDLVERSISGEKGKSNTKKNRKLFDGLKILIMDEADLLLERDFLEQTKKILKYIPKNTQVCIFSATFPDEILEITSMFMSPQRLHILVEKEKVNLDPIKSYKIDVEEERNKYEVLTEMYKNINICQAVIFVNSVDKADSLADRMCRDGHSVGVIHSKLSYLDRSDAFMNFRNMQTRVLIGTDLVSRGIDIEQVGLVINYDIPPDSSQYIHRVGRSGRFNKIGVAINFVTKYDHDKMKNIETKFNIPIPNLPTLDVINHYLTGNNGYNFAAIDKEC